MSLPYRPFDGDAWLGRDLPLDGGPYQIVPRPCTTRIRPIVPTTFIAVRCGANRRAICSISRPSSGPTTKTLTNIDNFQSMPWSMCIQ